MKIIINIITLLSASLLFFSCDNYDAPKVQIVSDNYQATRIWGTSSHAAFPSFVRFNNMFYCAFREGPAHLGSGGAVRVIRSLDGVKWETVQILQLIPPVPPTPTELTFNGSNQFMAIDHHSDFDFTNNESFSISGWIYTENISYTQIVSTRNGGSGYDFAQQDNKLINDFGAPYLRAQQASAGFSSNTWHHVGYVYDGANKDIRLYQNGTAVQLASATNLFPSIQVTTQENTYGNKITVFAKASNKGSGAAGGYTKGKMRTLRFWKKALNSADMAADMTTDVTAITPDLIAAYDFTKKEQEGTKIFVPDIKDKHPGILYNFSMDDTEVPPTDLRDPRLSITSDNKLMLLMDGEFYNGTTVASRRPYVSYSDANGENFSEPLRSDVYYPSENTLSEDNFWIWNVRQNNGSYYGVDYINNKIALFKSTDSGESFKIVKDLDRALLGNPSEVDLCFDKNDKMYALIRRNGSGNALATSKGYLATSLPPYTDWAYTELDYRVEGHNFMFLDDNSFIIGTRRFDQDNSNPQMAIYVTDLTGKIQKEIVLRSSGDCSYPGMVIHDNMLWVTYYSSHEGVASIYLSKIPLSDLTDK